ncbi:hypothetical protein ACFO1B_24145 [Dactylosporangium siamense]|uniref:hypothetical protein n=1 Tax=Dactylosporangium siamense TaxID=685454 RepID=UPI003570A46D
MTVNARRSGETATAALPLGHPDPLAVTTLMLTSLGSGGGVVAAAGAVSEENSMAPAAMVWNMEPPKIDVPWQSRDT